MKSFGPAVSIGTDQCFPFFLLISRSAVTPRFFMRRNKALAIVLTAPAVSTKPVFDFELPT
jgi:hypothetical protein